MDLIHPHSSTDVAEALVQATRDRTTVLPIGGRRHIDRGNPTEVDAELWTTMLDGIESYDPAEMLVTVGAGTRIDDLAGALAEHGQEWPVDAPGDATVGGVIAAGVSSPRRLRVGLMRDSVAELRFVTGYGRPVRSGARTVKNVTGYDLHRLATGSLGTLGVIVGATVKLRPLPAVARTLEVADGGLAVAARIATAVPQAAAVVATPEAVLVRLEGWPEEVDAQGSALRGVVAAEDVGDLEIPMPPSAVIAEVAVPPSGLARALDGVAAWTSLPAVGLAWVGIERDEELFALRARCAEHGGIAPVVSGPGGLGEPTIPAPQVHRRIKEAFDPAGIMAPGRFWGGM